MAFFDFLFSRRDKKQVSLRTFIKNQDKILRSAPKHLVIDCKKQMFREELRCILENIRLPVDATLEFKHAEDVHLRNVQAGTVLSDNSGVLSLRQYRARYIHAPNAQALNLSHSILPTDVIIPKATQYFLDNALIADLYTGEALRSQKVSVVDNVVAAKGDGLKQTGNMLYSENLGSDETPFIMAYNTLDQMYITSTVQYTVQDLKNEIAGPEGVSTLPKDQAIHAGVRKFMAAVENQFDENGQEVFVMASAQEKAGAATPAYSP